MANYVHDSWGGGEYIIQFYTISQLHFVCTIGSDVRIYERDVKLLGGEERGVSLQL